MDIDLLRESMSPLLDEDESWFSLSEREWEWFVVVLIVDGFAST